MTGMRDWLAPSKKGIEDPRVDVLELVDWVYSDQPAHLAAHRGKPRFGYGSGVLRYPTIAGRAELTHGSRS